MEEFTIYNELGEPTSKSATRSEPIKKGSFIPIIHVWFKTKNHKFLIQKRAKEDDLNPFQWATLSGLVLKGEPPLAAALRETYEEYGLNINHASFTLLKTVITKKGRYQTICFVYEVMIEDSVTLTLNKEEVSETKFVSLDQIYTLIQHNQFWNYKELLHDEDYFELLEKSVL
jgi:8-oxo-dGTP pyrophosphatase MutT (NUDIX family)